ncbi:MAG: hypothetical protein IT204_24285 [Fimbriimonadaceae bacterium]|nr:hypothetical protein [Fimbriimonadaceae bacterium]
MTATLLALLLAGSRYPDDPTSRPLLDRWPAFETVAGVQPAGHPVQRAADYTVNELRAATLDGAPATLWRFAPRPGRGAVLCFHDRLRRAPRAVSVKVRNDSPEALVLAVSAAEIPWSNDLPGPWRQWAVNAPASLPAGATQTVTFDLTAWQPQPPGPPAAPRWPTTVNLHAGALHDGVEYRLLLADWTVQYDPAPGITAVRLTLPARVTASQPAALRLQASGLRDGDRADLEWRAGERTLWRLRLDPAQVAGLAAGVDLTVTVPWYLPPGPLNAGLVVNGVRTADPPVRTTVINGLRPAFPQTARRLHRGRPTVFVDGQPWTWAGYASYEYQPGNFNAFGAVGANLLVVPLAAGRHVHQIAANTCSPPDGWDYGELDERVALALGANPQARLLLRVSLALPVAWLQEHPDAIARIRTPNGDVLWEETGCLAPSLASRDWLAQQQRCLQSLLEHCSRQPWARAVVGVMPTGLVTEEWFAWGCNDGLYGDYSPATQAAFGGWCAAQGLPWRAVPAPEARQAAAWDVYPDTPAGRSAVAYARFNSALSAQVIGEFCRTVKAASGGRLLAGTFYGYLLQLAGEPRQHLAGQFDLSRLLACPDVDFVAGIPLHNFRRLVGGYDTFTSATASIQAAGKVYLNENDLFSWLHHAHWQTPYDPADPRAACVQMHRRAVGNTLVHGALWQWFSLLASWHDDPALLAEFGRQIALQGRGQEFDREAVAEVALLVDDASFAARPPETRLPLTNQVDLLHHLATAGAPVEVWLLRDAGRLPARIKLAVVTDSPAPDAAGRSALQALLAAGGRTVVVLGAPGLVDPASGGWDLTAPGRLLDLPLTVDPTPRPAATLLAADGRAVPGPATVCPRLQSPAAGWLRYVDGPTAGLERALPAGGRLVWSGVTPAAAELPQSWLTAAGIHRYGPPGSTVQAARGLVAITAAAGGELELQWPTAVAVSDLFDGWTAAGRQFRCPFTPGQTRLFAVRQ